ncbi:MAG: SUMF1/EgtB/PvdO family nonheme iron enzyme, partial [Rhodospirillales bacterium]|nr:SUMF1/EgtB/PvdO family nonheme iron enzyme [Rhodospirillales bacterium]
MDKNLTFRRDSGCLGPPIGRRNLLVGAAFLPVLASLPAAAESSPAAPETVPIPAGPFIAGSDAAEREAAYRLDEVAYGHSATRQQGWYDNEPPRTAIVLDAFAIARTPVTNRQYAAFVAATGHPAPDVDEKTWLSYRLIHPYARTRRYAWNGGRPPTGREDHPVVLVSQGDAAAYAAWLARAPGNAWRLPNEAEWEKAAR